MVTLNDFLIIENNSEIFDFRFEFDNILMWPFIRVILYDIPIFKECKLVNPQALRERLSLKDEVLYIKNTILNNPYKGSLKKYDILMFCSGITNVRKKKKYLNRFIDYFAFVYKDKSLLIEDSVRRKYYTPRVFPNICYHDFIRIMGYIRSKFPKASSKDIFMVKSFLGFLKEKFPYKLEDSDLRLIGNYLLRISKSLNVFYYFYNKLFDKFDPKIIFLKDASYGVRSYILKWAKSRNIITIELQHGLVSKNHRAYNYGGTILSSDEYKEYLPNYFLTYGKYWSDSINLPVKKVIIGNPNYSENMKKTKNSVDGGKDKTKKEILIISGGVMPNIFKKLALEISSVVDNSKYDIVFRPHPSECPMVKDRYCELFICDKIRLDSKQDIYLSLTRSDFVIGAASTVLFEALGICKGVFVIDHPLTDLHVPKGIIKRFSSVEELLDLIQRCDNLGNETDINYVWEPNWESNFKRFMNNLIEL
ncbi:MAG: hypothetical protein KAW56_00070 [Candidatus Marinimicrobia bacterium]|nr:hypothetical protein [Candidatus Neomarinimicrobiota bacterium]